MTLPHFTHIRPKSLADAVGHLRSPKARILAGGTDLLGCLRDRVFDAEKLVSIGHLDKLEGIDRTPDGGMRIGALATIAELAASGLIRQSYPALARGAAEVASPQLRNQGTLGGNLCQKPRCWYYRGEFLCLRKGGDKCYAYDGENQYHCILGGSVCFITHPSDTAPALVAYDAVIRVAGPNGFREVPAGKFHILPEESVEKETVLAMEEIVTEIFLPPPRPGWRSSYRKVRARRSWDFALAGVALALKFRDDVVAEARVVIEEELLKIGKA
jgi:xanthine dehydrogenase YagS FAD-binding subunit